MRIETNHSLKSLTTFQVDARAKEYACFTSGAQILDFLKHRNIHENKSLILGGGSNLLFVGDYDGIVLHPMLRGVTILKKDGSDILVRAMAGENWDDFVALTVARGWGGLENLSFIPGYVGACPVQNIGAYGVEAETIIESVEAISVSDQRIVQLPAKACGFKYRYSHFKGRWKNQYIVISVVFRLSCNPRFVTHYPDLLDTIGDPGRINPKTIRDAVIQLRKSKLPDPAKLGNAGSFFKNPVVTASEFENLIKYFPALPHYPQGDHGFKLPAGWLIDQCGWKGKALGKAAVHNRQALVLVNTGGATGEEILELSRRIQASVRERFAIDLEREVQIIM